MQNQITTIFFDLFGVLLGIDQSVVVQYLSKLTGAPYLETREVAMGESFMRLERSEINFTQYVDVYLNCPRGYVNCFFQPLSKVLCLTLSAIR